jgi:hypothetical protein
MPFNVEDYTAVNLLRKISNTLTEILERLMSTTPVSQASFDAALNDLVTGFNALVTTGQAVADGLVKVEAALVAAQGSATPADFSAELAIVQGLQAQIATDQTAAQALVAGLPTLPIPPQAPTPTP